jgi:hypothetical protein
MKTLGYQGILLFEVMSTAEKEGDEESERFAGSLEIR